jgi:hypothetical protein
MANIGEDDLILGYPFLEATNPKISWTEGIIEGTVILLTAKSHLEQSVGST